MSDGKMQELIDKIRRQYPSFTNKEVESKGYVYVVKNKEILIAVGRSTTINNEDAALTGQITDLEHANSGIAMMASAYYRSRNNIFYIPTSKTKGAEIERELKQIEKNVKNLVLNHYDIADKKAGDIYCNGTTKNKDVASLLKRFLYENLPAETTKELNEPKFSFMELLDMVNENGDAWHSLIKNQKTAQFACKLLGINK